MAPRLSLSFVELWCRRCGGGGGTGAIDRRPRARKASESGAPRARQILRDDRADEGGEQQEDDLEERLPRHDHVLGPADAAKLRARRLRLLLLFAVHGSEPETEDPSASSPSTKEARGRGRSVRRTGRRGGAMPKKIMPRRRPRRLWRARGSPASQRMPLPSRFLSTRTGAGYGAAPHAMSGGLWLVACMPFLRGPPPRRQGAAAAAAAAARAEAVPPSSKRRRRRSAGSSPRTASTRPGASSPPRPRPSPSRTSPPRRRRATTPRRRRGRGRPRRRSRRLPPASAPACAP